MFTNFSDLLKNHLVQKSQRTDKSKSSQLWSEPCVRRRVQGPSVKGQKERERELHQFLGDRGGNSSRKRVFYTSIISIWQSASAYSTRAYKAPGRISACDLFPFFLAGLPSCVWWWRLIGILGKLLSVVSLVHLFPCAFIPYLPTNLLFYFPPSKKTINIKSGWKKRK